MASRPILTRRRFVVAGLLAATAGAMLGIPPVRRWFHPLVTRLRGRRTIEQRLAEFTDARRRIEAACARAGVAFPPARVVLVGFKDEKRLDVYASATDEKAVRQAGEVIIATSNTGPPNTTSSNVASLRHVASYPVLAASGTAGPKRKAGDRQVPEGVYAIESLNPDSRFHVALRVAYPNELDRAQAAAGTDLGGDIMIHGGAASVGCLALGDPAAEDLFVLSARVGIERVTLLLAPCDLRTRALPTGVDGQDARYVEIRHRLTALDMPV